MTIDKVVIIKAGTWVLVSRRGDKFKYGSFIGIAGQFPVIMAQGYNPVIISSGAVVGGNGIAGQDDSKLAAQVAAGVGQPELMFYWRRAFKAHKIIVSQCLLTHKEAAKPTTIATLRRMLELGIVPILNENDTVSTEEVKSDNDALAAIVAINLQAQSLIILSEVDGLYRQDPRVNPNVKPIPTVHLIDRKIMRLANLIDSDRETGMRPKLRSIRKANRAGIVGHMAKGERQNVIIDVLGGNPPGTTFLAAQ